MSEQNGAAYALGVSMGILSYHATAGNTSPVHDGLAVAAQAAARVEATGIDLDTSGFQNQELTYFEQCYTSPDTDFDSLRVYTRNQVTPVVVNLRGLFQGAIEGSSAAAGQAYVLGVAIGIAEGQATAGEAARAIVHDALGKALAAAKSLGLDTSELEAILSMSKPDLKDVYMRITNLRGVLQGRVEAGAKPPTIRIPTKR